MKDSSRADENEIYKPIWLAYKALGSFLDQGLSFFLNFVFSLNVY